MYYPILAFLVLCWGILFWIKVDHPSTFRIGTGVITETFPVGFMGRFVVYLLEKIMKKAKEQIVKLSFSLREEQVNLEDLIVQEGGNEWRKRRSEDGKIDWRMGSYQIYNLVRALAKPYVGAHFIYKEKEYKVWRVKEYITDKYENIEPGKIKGFFRKSFLGESRK